MEGAAAQLGGGGLHRFGKETVEAFEAPFLLQGTLTALPQGIADNDLLTWEAVSARHQNATKALWRKTSLHEQEEVAPLASELKTAARMFKSGTGVGVDAISPRMLPWLSDPLLEAIGNTRFP